MENANSQLKAYLQLHFIVLIWGATAVLGKLISIPPLGVVLYRTLIAAGGIYLIILFKQINYKLPKEELIKILSTGILIALHWITFFLAARLSNISICLAGIATTSFWTSFIDPIVNKRPIKFYEPLLGVLSLVGIVLVFNASFDQFLGLSVAIASAILASLFTVINGRLIARQNHYTISMYEMLGAFGTTLMIIPLASWMSTERMVDYVSIQNWDWAFLLFLGVICTVFAYSLGVKLMKQLSAFSINLTINLEPVYGIIMALIIFKDDEHMGTGFYVGTSIIILSVLLYPLVRKLTKDRYMNPEVLQ
ncbi:DMT family transporter [Reichenbachiella agarivorans]|uniref:DMT family transporter n=1 Tax=Reichenbachiella agarivorans TaxID=2979464 RepID=A0ABY6CJM7_9BACT|nr:DMT family transporter [Reichenbachiella agarivorans]UXP30726.1 DMT family transporter [Reichenbachiella agarivorans]